MNKYIDEDGYPTEKALRYIRNYDCTKNPPKMLVEFIEDIWMFRDWGFKLRKRRKNSMTKYLGEKMELELHTGGWSGNEDIIRALEKNKWFYCFYWLESSRGGHYKFDFNYDTFDKMEKE